MTTAELAGKALDLSFDTAGILQYFVEHETVSGNTRNMLANSYKVVIDACSTNKTSFFRKGEADPPIKSYGRITYPNTILPDGRVVVEQYEIRRSFMEETLSKNNFPNPKACYDEWTSMGVLDRDKDRPTRSRKIDKSSDKSEDVFVLRVFGTTLATPASKPKSKLIKRPLVKPSPQLVAMLKDTEEDENDERTT